MADGGEKLESPDAAEVASRRSRRASRRSARADGVAAQPNPAAEGVMIDGRAAAPNVESAGAASRPEAQEKPVSGALAKIEPVKAPAVNPRKALQTADPVDQEALEAARAAREARMREIRRELRRRRRLRALGMLLRFAIFVMLPTGFVGWYYFEKATDMYVSESAMVFKSGSGAAAGGGGLLGSLMGGAAPTDSVALQEYIVSRDILKRLDEEHGVISHFQSMDIDWWHRLPADATFDDAYKYYAGGFIMPGKVSVSYDIAEGIVRLEMVAATPEAAKRFADAIIGYGEELVNKLNERSRGDGVRMADKQVEKARSDLLDAERRVAEVQERQNSFSATGEATAIQGEITTLEVQRREIEAQIEQLRTITRDENDTRFVPYRTQLKILDGQIAALRSKLTGGGDRELEGPSMAQLSSELRLAETDLMAANMMYSSALTAKETALQTAASQSLFLETVTTPTVPQKASRPKRLQNTGLVFLICFAAYIIGLLTFSLIREQAAI